MLDDNPFNYNRERFKFMTMATIVGRLADDWFLRYMNRNCLAFIEC